MMAMKNRVPARFPKNDMNQDVPTSMTETLRWRKAVVMNLIYQLDTKAQQLVWRPTMMLLVKRSAPVKTIMTSPMGNTSPPTVLMRPGAFSWYQGAAFVLNSHAHPKPNSGPVMKELKNNLSIRMWAFLQPIRETSSIVC